MFSFIYKIFIFFALLFHLGIYYRYVFYLYPDLLIDVSVSNTHPSQAELSTCLQQLSGRAKSAHTHITHLRLMQERVTVRRGGRGSCVDQRTLANTVTVIH